MLATQRVDTTQFIRHRFGLGEILEAYVFAPAGGIGALKVTLFPDLTAHSSNRAIVAGREGSAPSWGRDADRAAAGAHQSGYPAQVTLSRPSLPRRVRVCRVGG
jgi:hypothetical protein